MKHKLTQKLMSHVRHFDHTYDALCLKARSIYNALPAPYSSQTQLRPANALPVPIHVILHTIKGVEGLSALLANVRGLLATLLVVVGPVGPVGLVGGRVPRVARLGAVGVEPLHAGEVVLGEALLVVAVLRHVDVGGAVGAFDLGWD